MSVDLCFPTKEGRCCFLRPGEFIKFAGKRSQLGSCLLHGEPGQAKRQIPWFCVTPGVVSATEVFEMIEISQVSADFRCHRERRMGKNEICFLGKLPFIHLPSLMNLLSGNALASIVCLWPHEWMVGVLVTVAGTEVAITVRTRGLPGNWEPGLCVKKKRDVYTHMQVCTCVLSNTV